MKACIYYIKIFFLILFNNIVDITSYIGVRVKKGLTLIFSKLKVIFTKLIYILILLGNKIKLKLPIIRQKIKNGLFKIGNGCKAIGFIISNAYINLKYKLFIAYLKHKEKSPKYPEVYRGEEIKEDITESEEVENLIEESSVDEINENISTEESEIEVENKDILQEKKEIEEVQEKLIEETSDNDISIENEEKIIVKESPITLRKATKFIFVCLSWLLITGLSMVCIVLAENTFLGLDLDRPFLYNIKLLTREQAQLLILIGLFFALVAASELLVFLFRFITCRPILQHKLFSDFTLGIVCSYFTGMCFVAKEEINVAIEAGSIKNIELLTYIGKALPFIAIIFFLIGAIKLMVAFNGIFEKENIDDK